MASSNQRIGANDGDESTNPSNRNPPPVPPATTRGLILVVEPPATQAAGLSSSEDDEEFIFEKMSDDIATITKMIDNIESDSQLASQEHRQLLERTTLQEQELQRSKQEVVQLQKRVDEVSKQLQDKQNEIFVVTQKNQQLTDQLGASEKRAEQDNKFLSEAKIENEELNREVEELRKKLHESEASQKLGESQDAKSEKENLDLIKKIKRLQDENGILQIRMWKLEENQQSSLNEALELVELNAWLENIADIPECQENCVEMEEVEQLEKADDGQAGDQPNTRQSLKLSDNTENMSAFASSNAPPQNKAMPGSTENEAVEKDRGTCEVAMGYEENEGNDKDSHSEEDGFPRVELLPEMVKGANRTISQAQCCTSRGNSMEPQPGPSSSAVLNAPEDSIPSPPLASPFFRVVSEAEAIASIEFWTQADSEFEPDPLPEPTPEEQQKIDEFAAAFREASFRVDMDFAEKRREEREKQKKKLEKKKKKGPGTKKKR